MGSASVAVAASQLKSAAGDRCLLEARGNRKASVERLLMQFSTSETLVPRICPIRRQVRKFAMVNRALIRTLENDPEIESVWKQELANFEEAGLFPEHGSISADFEVNKIVEGRILRVEEGNVMVDIGF